MWNGGEILTNFKIVFGGVIGFILLLLYSGTVAYMIFKIVNCDASQCKKDFGEGIIYVVTTVGGLVSALVISKLTITKPGDNPAVVLMTEAVDEDGITKTSLLATSLTLLYIIVWIFTGLIALILGVMIYPDANSTISDLGTSWLGLAVAASYAYFGISPKSSPDSGENESSNSKAIS